MLASAAKKTNHDGFTLALVAILLFSVLWPAGAEAQQSPRASIRPALPGAADSAKTPPRSALPRLSDNKQPPAASRNSPINKEPEIVIAPISLPPESIKSSLAPAAPLFRIGYLSPTRESPLDQRWYLSLKQTLLKDKAMQEAMQNEHISSVALRPCDGPEDMLQRMGQQEFDLVFAPALVYVRDRIANHAIYQVLYQAQRSGDSGDTRGGGLVRHRGSLFVRRGSPLDKATIDGSPRKIGRSLKNATIAVSGPYDAAGYFYIRKMLWENFNSTVPAEYLYLGSPQAVVKAVTSGLVDVGACEESVLEEVFDILPAHVAERGRIENGSNAFVRKLAATSWLQTDPVLLHRRYHPKISRSALGHAAATVLRSVYNTNPRNLNLGAMPRLEPGDSSNYDSMVEDVENAREYP